MFPGQGSQYPAMIERALHLAPDANAPVLAAASNILGRDLLACYRSDNPTAYASEREVHVGVFLANHLYLRMLEASGVRADLSLGLSVGEYNHLVHIGALEFGDALRLVDARGAALDRAPRGLMAAVYPMELTDLEVVVARASAYGTLEIAAYNSPGHHVISGERRAIQVALRVLEQEREVQTVVLDSRAAMHSSAAWPVVPAFVPALQRAAWRAIGRPYLPNAAGRFLSRPTAGDLIYLLTLQVWRPVRWQQSIEFLSARYPNAIFVEVGPHVVASGRRGWRPSANLRTDNGRGEDPRLAFDRVVRALGAVRVGVEAAAYAA